MRCPKTTLLRRYSVMSLSLSSSSPPPRLKPKPKKKKTKDTRHTFDGSYWQSIGIGTALNIDI